MQCPSCGQELNDQAHCQTCDLQDKPPAEAMGVPEATATEGINGELNVHPDHGSLSQPADSSHQPAGTESPAGEDAPPRDTPPAAPDIKITVSGSTVDAKGNINIIGVAQGFLDQTDQPKVEEENSLYSLTKRRPQRPVELHRSVQVEIDDLVSQLRNTRLMFITCASREFAIEAGYAANARLGIANPDQDRVLRYADAASNNLEFRVQRLLKQLPSEGETAIVVDAYETSAEAFSDSILNDKAWVNIIKADLESNHLFLVITVSPKYARKRLMHVKRNLPFAYWELPFLRPFLEQNYPDQFEKLEADIIKQRAQGIWEEDETDFCQQIISFHDNEQLQSIVESGGPKDSEISAATLLKGSSPVEKTVLYTAAFFPDITPLEFCRVVEALLSKRTMRVSAPTDGANRVASSDAAQTEVPLTRIWEEEKDNIFTNWLREASFTKDSVRVVNLSSSALREPLRRLFEKQHRFYVIDQFKALQERGIFFYPSLRLAENTTRIAVEMAGFYPDEFNEDWIVELVTRLSQHFESELAGAPDGMDAMFQFVQGSHPGALNLAFARVSNICRHMLESPHLKGMVQNSLEQLMKRGYHKEVLWLVKHLQFTQDFDQLYWLKQLLHRADPRTRHLAYYSLYYHLKRMGSGVYEVLTKIETWLPRPERAPNTYSQVEYFALRLLIQYCLETVGRFDPKHYGKWPSRYPLFAIKDKEAADECMSLLSRWLLHPGIEATLVGLRMGGTQMALIGALLAEWTFILLSPRDPALAAAATPPAGNGARTAVGTEGDASAGFSAVTLHDLLIRQFAFRTDLTQRLELLMYWNRLNHDLLKFLGSLSPASELRKELIWKRDLIGRLITQFKSVSTGSKTTQPPVKESIIGDTTLA
jgi:hypothetical protein